ncbi:hypothetical protein [Deinococcus enclensis]|uniref:Uncharacterized protein n=1 Tax=Deinococcus enclensis TaxID=1049582 RepID=A0ABT9ME81_9DEIO|nr:hypothetical protein [Deinococcus enclensis]MDP9764883.1 hypothetical protein [Deinococcus enclensis]
MATLDDLRTETDALREFLQALAAVYSTGTDLNPLVREELRLAWTLAEGVVQANEAFMAFADPEMEMAEEFLNITQSTRASLAQVSGVVERFQQLQADIQQLS